MMTESLEPPLQARAKQMGIAQLRVQARRSPSSTREQFEADLRAFAAKMRDRRAAAPARGRPRAGAGAGAQPAAPQAAAAAPRRRRRSCRAQFAMLQQRLDELRGRSDADADLGPGDEGGARVLRARASCSWSRTTRRAAWAASAPAPRGESLNLLAREIVDPARRAVGLPRRGGRAQALRGAAAGRAAGRQLPAGHGSAASSPARWRSCRCSPTARRSRSLFGDNPESGRAAGRAWSPRGVHATRPASPSRTPSCSARSRRCRASDRARMR